MYNPDTDSYPLFYPSDNHEEWLPFSEVVKLLPKNWARDEEQVNTGDLLRSDRGGCRREVLDQSSTSRGYLH